MNYRQREVAYRRFCARLFADTSCGWVLKGGVALTMRLDPNRGSNDVDLSYLSADHAAAHQALVAAAQLDLGDHFTFRVTSSTPDLDAHPAEATRSLHVVASVGNRVWCQFTIDLALPQVDVEYAAEPLAPLPLTGLAAVDEVPGLLALSIPAQLADKVCALYERHGDGRWSTRARDLADIAMIANQTSGIEADALSRAIERQVELRREAGSLAAPLPTNPTLAPGQIADWRPRWTKATRGAPITLDHALSAYYAFITPVLTGQAAGTTWHHVRRKWTGST